MATYNIPNPHLWISDQLIINLSGITFRPFTILKKRLILVGLVQVFMLNAPAQTTLLNVTNPNTTGPRASAGYSGTYTFSQSGYYHITVKGASGGDTWYNIGVLGETRTGGMEI